MQEEQSATGGVSWAVVKAYITALGGWPVVVLLFTVFILAELFRVGATVWLSIWTGERWVRYAPRCVWDGDPKSI